MQRPREVSLAVLFAAIATAIATVSIFSLKDDLGDGWLLIASFRVFVAIVYAVLLILSFNGAGWVRYVYTALFAVGLIGFRNIGLSAFLNVAVVGALIANVVAISLWFSRASNEWYRNAFRVRRQQSDA